MPAASEAPAAQPATERHPNIESRTTSNDLSDLLSQLGDGTEEHFDASAPLTDPRDLERPADPARVVVESTGAISYQPEFASFGARAGGWVIDTVVTTAALVPGLIMFSRFGGALRILGVLVALAGFAAVAASYTRSISRSGQWIGNRVTSTTVVRVSSGEFLDPTHAGTRFVARAIISPILGAGFLMALTNTSRRTFHDQLAESIVTRPSRASWSLGSDGSSDGSNDGDTDRPG